MAKEPDTGVKIFGCVVAALIGIVLIIEFLTGIRGMAENPEQAVERFLVALRSKDMQDVKNQATENITTYAEASGSQTFNRDEKGPELEQRDFKPTPKFKVYTKDYDYVSAKALIVFENDYPPLEIELKRELMVSWKIDRLNFPFPEAEEE